MKDLNQAFRAIFWMIFAGLCYTLLASIVRYLSEWISSFELAFFRCLFAVLFLTPLIARSGLDGLKTSRLPMHCLRMVFSYGGILSSFYAFSLMPVADVYALQFTTPLFTMILAVLFLKERVGTSAFIATIVGFAGTLVIIRPGFAEVSAVIAAPLISAVSYAGANVTIKSLSRTESTLVITLYLNLLSLPLALVPALFVWTTPAREHVPWLIALGIISVMAQFSLTHAIGKVDARVIQPFDFVRMPVAALAGYVFFSELPDIWIWVGAAIIFISSYYVLSSESRSQTARKGGTSS